MIRNLIWDVDGTLFDTYPAIVHSLQYAAADFGVQTEYDDVRDLALVSVDHCLEQLSSTHALPIDDLGDGFERHYRAISAADQPPFDGVREVCQLINESGGLNLIGTHRRRVGLDLLLAKYELAVQFADIISHDDGFPRKPDATSFLTMIERHRLPLDETLAVGDRDLDILAAHAAGIPGALFGGGPTTAAPDFVIREFADLQRMIEAQSTRARACATRAT